MKVKILTGGPDDCIPNEIYDYKSDNWCGVDIGASKLIEHDINPLLSIGDFDSSTARELELVRLKSKKTIYKPLKDDITDTELALRYLITNYEIDQIELYGATGGRLDQLLANIFFILKPCYQNYVEKIQIIDKWNKIKFFLPGSHQLEKDNDMKYLAFVPLTQVKELELPDEKYTLNKTNFMVPVSLSSNEFIGKNASFSFKSGVVMVIQSKD